MTQKLIRDGKVAVLYSPGFGAGWSTWHSDSQETLIFDAEIAEAVERGDTDAVIQLATSKVPNLYIGGARDLEIAWLPVGTRFTIEEYDGNESLRTIDDLTFTA